jgi:hypothetical protein
MDNIPFLLLSGFCTTSSAQNTKNELNHAIAVPKSNKYQDPFVDDYGLNSSVLLKTEG